MNNEHSEDAVIFSRLLSVFNLMVNDDEVMISDEFDTLLKYLHNLAKNNKPLYEEYITIENKILDEKGLEGIPISEIVEMSETLKQMVENIDSGELYAVKTRFVTSIEKDMYRNIKFE